VNQRYEMCRQYVGIDLHRRRNVVLRLDGEGEWGDTRDRGRVRSGRGRRCWTRWCCRSRTRPGLPRSGGSWPP
jgi:hypothetical protein